MAQGVENQHQTEESRKNVKPASVKEQRKVVADALDETPKKGQTWYLVEAKWFKAFQTYVNYERYGKSNEEAPAEENFGGDHPGPIDNTPLIVAEDSQSTSKFVRIHEHVQDKKDFELLPESAWTQISSWYGGGPAIARQVIEQGEVNKRTLIELHPYVIFAAVYTSDQATSDAEAIQFEEMAFSKTTTLQEVTDAIASKHRVDDKEKFELRLWAGYKGSPYKMYKTTELPKELEYTITRTHGQQVILEVKDRSSLQEDAWPISYKHSASMGAGVASQKTGIGGLSSGFLRGNDTEIVSRHSTKSTNSWIGGASGNFQGGEPGVCGLQNLGNTCFMNSALQCLTKTPFFVDYFNAGKYVKEINTTNPLGMGGKIAEAFGNLMQEVWSGKHSYTAPREFKWIIGKFKPEFSGYNQQDSHELITFLLDGLHEDLNRIVDKPQTNSVEANGRADEEVSKEAWEVHKKRNDSIIVDRFQGQLKSTIVCPEPECVQENFVSITFDPFMYLGLSLPTEKNRIVDVTVYRFGNDLAPVKYGVKVSKNGPSSELRQALAKMINDANAEQPGFVPVKAEEFVLADIFNNKIYRFIPDTSPITSISESDTIHAYEVPGLTKECHSEYDNYSSKQPPFFGVRLCTVERHEQYYGVSLRTVSVGIPFVLPYDKSKTTKKDVYNQALKFVSRYIKKEALPEFKIDWEDPASFLPTPKKKLEAKEGEEQIVKAPAEAEQKNILFEMKFDSGYLEESNDPAILYSDDLVSKQEDNEDEELGRYNYRRSYVSEKKNLMLLIHPAVLSKLVEKERLNQITVHSTGKGVVEKKEKGVSLEDCLTLYTTKETLSQENTYYCPKCKKHVQATQKFDIWKAPEILVIHLKRFQNNRYTRDKIETYVDYPYTLDISSHLPEAVKQQEHTVYDLYAVSNHFGGLGGGHYTAYAKVHTNNKWYKFDDSSTMEVDAANVKTSAGYVLFYRSRKSSNSVELPTK